VLVEVLLDAGTAKVKAHFQVVLADFPGEIFDELVVGIHALLRRKTRDKRRFSGGNGLVSRTDTFLYHSRTTLLARLS
jgi:hypothetical protein